MKKYLLATFLTILFLTAAVTPVGAVTIPNPVGDMFKDFPSIINSFGTLIRIAATLGFLAMMIYGGFTKLTAAGNAEQEAKAMKILQAGIIGFVLIVIAYPLVQVIGAFLGIKLFQ